MGYKTRTVAELSDVVCRAADLAEEAGDCVVRLLYGESLALKGVNLVARDDVLVDSSRDGPAVTTLWELLGEA